MAKRNWERGVADYLLASKRCEIQSLEQLLRMGQLVGCISHLVHLLQLERGASNMFIGSSGERCADVRLHQVAAACRAERALRDCLNRLDMDSNAMAGDSRLFSRIAYAIHGLDELRSVRQNISAMTTAPETIIDGYSELIQSLLAIVYETADSAADPEVSRVLVALFHLMQGKELAGQERAVGSAGFAQGQFDANSSQRLRRLIEGQERCFHVFLNFAEESVLESWNQLMTGHGAVVMERLRRIAVTSETGQADRDLSDAWFALTSKRIESMKEIEHAMETTLSDLCRRKIAHAQQDLDSHKVHLDALSKQVGQPAFAVFFSGDVASTFEGEEPGTYETGCAGPQLGRALFDLVHSQAVRLQTMSEELQAARAALTERKTIEKAKGLIMKSRQVSEDEAYRFLRKVAMAQNRRLADVARDALTMAELFPVTA